MPIPMIKRLFTLIFILFLTGVSYATHIVGGELSYEHVNGNNYKITLKVYRDCINGQAPFDNPASIGLFNAAGNLIQEIQIPSPTITTLPIVITNPCLQVPPVVCTEEAIYEITVPINIPSGGIDLIYQRCCRNSIIQNIISPASMGSTYISHIPDPSLAINNTGAHFINVPPLVLCNGDNFVFDHSAIDPDGDVLVYEMCTPFQGASSSAPMPQPPNGGPYPNIAWSGGYSVNSQILGSQNLQINSTTGELICTPNTNGVFVVGICVKEYRNGVLINTTLRDFQFNVVSCSSNVISAVPNQTLLCDGYTMDFDNQSTNSSFYHWDFGVPGLLSDTSILEEPTYTFPDTGSYEITLIANPGWPCADTTTAFYNVQYPIQGSIDPIVNQCKTNNNFDFAINGNFTPTATFSWVFGGASTPLNSTSQSPNSVTYSNSGIYTVTSSVSDRGCSRDFTQAVEVYSEPIADVEDLNLCETLTANFVNNTTNATNYRWNFGDLTTLSDSSLINSPSYVYPNFGSFNVNLIATNAHCADTTTSTVFIKQPINPSFTINQTPQCIDVNSFTYNLSGLYSNLATFNWDFGGATTTNPNTTESPNNITYNNAGTYPVIITISDEGCVASYTDTIQVFPSPSIAFSITDTLGCNSATTKFNNESIAWGDVNYLWNFGDGTTSTEFSPTHTYPNIGDYDVSLNLTTNDGCLVNLNLSELDAVNVYPVPNAAFEVSPEETTIFFPDIVVTDFSSGADSLITYNSEGNTFTNEQEFYTTQGMGYIDIIQTVINNYGCADTAIQTVYVKPENVIYVPNTFTPNGDGVNELFVPKYFGLTEVTLYIFDRWGHIIHEDSSDEVSWDGTHKNKAVQEGVYIWKIEYKNHRKRYNTKMGHVTLLR